MKLTNLLIAFSLGIPLVAASAHADDRAGYREQQAEILQMDDLPVAVRATVRHEARDRDVETIRKDLRDGRLVYSVEIMHHGRVEFLDITPSGHVLDRHDERWGHERGYH